LVVVQFDVPKPQLAEKPVSNQHRRRSDRLGHSNSTLVSRASEAHSPNYLFLSVKFPGPLMTGL